MGYRYYETAGVKVRFPFGHGLSYTNFTYSDLQVEDHKVSCIVKNKGTLFGKEVVQLYIEPVKSSIFRPIIELKGFEKVELAPGESKKVTFALNERSFAVWSDGWKVPAGTYKICVGKSCQDICLVKEIFVDGESVSDQENLPKWYRTLMGTPTQADLETLIERKIIEKPLKKGEFTKENTIMEMKDDSLIMKLLYWGVEAVMAKRNGGKDYTNPNFRMMMSTATDGSVSCIHINGGIKGKLLEGLVEIANGRFFKGIRMMLTK